MNWPWMKPAPPAPTHNFKRFGTTTSMQNFDRTEAHPEGPRNGWLAHQDGFPSIFGPDGMMTIHLLGGDMTIDLKLDKAEALSLAAFIKRHYDDNGEL